MPLIRSVIIENVKKGKNDNEQQKSYKMNNKKLLKAVFRCKGTITRCYYDALEAPSLLSVIGATRHWIVVLQVKQVSHDLCTYTHRYHTGIEVAG